jgi:hypothetical protein
VVNHTTNFRGSARTRAGKPVKPATAKFCDIWWAGLTSTERVEFVTRNAGTITAAIEIATS